MKMMYTVCAAALAAALVAPCAEGAVKAKDVPPLLVTDAGKSISDSKEWESERRDELKKWFLENEYGVLPAAAKVPDVMFEDAAPPRPAFGGIATERRVKASCRGPYGVFSFEFTAYVPVKNVPSPAFLLIATRDIKEKDDDLARMQKTGYWPAKDIVKRGYAAVAFVNYDVAADTYTSETALASGVFVAYEKPSERTPKSWGALRAWAWGASRVMDWIEDEPTIDASRVAVVGHSRGGKAALVAGVTDTRFAMVCSNCSGTGGARIMHINLPKSEPWTSWAHFGVQYWFAPAATDPGISWEKHDQHQFLALIAPRLLCVRSKTLDDWAGPDGERECVRFAKPAWDLYGAGDNVGYAIAKGRHSLDARDWSSYMDFADKRMTTAYAESMRGAFAAESGAGEIVLCDQLKQTIDIYDAGGSNVWRWCAKDDPVLQGGDKGGFMNNVAESKPFWGGSKIGMVSCGGRWAVIDREKRAAVAWGRSKGLAHSIELVGSDVVAVVTTDGGNSLYLFDISGDAAMNPYRQKQSALLFDSPHGLHYDGKNLWLVDTPGLHRCSISRDAEGVPVAKVEKTWPFSELGVIHGHDLRPVPRTSLLAMTTHEKVLFFDMKTESWREDMFIERIDVKAFDPAPDGKSFLVTTAKTKWWTDSLEICTPGKKGEAAAFTPSLVIPGAKIYKARWVK